MPYGTTKGRIREQLFLHKQVVDMKNRKMWCKAFKTR